MYLSWRENEGEKALLVCRDRKINKRTKSMNLPCVCQLSSIVAFDTFDICHFAGAALALRLVVCVLVRAFRAGPALWVAGCKVRPDPTGSFLTAFYLAVGCVLAEA